MKRTYKTREAKASEEVMIPPHSIEAEQGVLGGLLLDSDSWLVVSENLVADDFYHHAHRLIFQAMEMLARQSRQIDLITVLETLKAQQQAHEVGGIAYLAELSQNTPSVANILEYADIVRRAAILRELIGIGNQIARNAYQAENKDVAEILDKAEQDVFNIAEKRAKSGEEPKDAFDILTSTIEKIEFLRLSGSGLTGVDTGFEDLNQKTSGLQPSELIIVAARPSMGKTTFAMNLCENALDEHKPVLVFSLEMPAEQIMMRMLASLSRVDQTRVRTGQLTDEEMSKISSTMNILASKKLYIDDSSGLTPTELRARARRLHAKHNGLKLIIVDYLQLMRAPAFSENRTLEIAEISRSLKALAKELEVPVVALSQLNRSLENRHDKRPINSDLRESGSIEQDADLIMFIYREEVYESKPENKGMAEVIIGKQRNGPIGSIKLTFEGQYSRFKSYAPLRNINPAMGL